MRNIILLTFDSVRADHCGYLDYGRDTTPNMDSLAADGSSYTNAIAPASRTNPSMAGIMTGRPMYYRGKVANPKHARRHLGRHGTMAEDLTEWGFATGAFCPNAYASRYYGFDRGFDRFEDFLFTRDRYQNLWERHIEDSGWFTTFRNLRNFVRGEEAFRAWDTYIDDAVAWTQDQTDPFFLWIFSLDTHYPYLTPRTYRRYSSLFDQYYYNWQCYKFIDELDADFSEKTKQKMIDIYDDAIRYADKLIGQLQKRLAEFDPVFVIHSDHGEAFGERGMYGHSFPYLYEENTHVPMVISGLNEQSDVSKPVSLLRLRESLSRLVEGELPDLTSDYALSTEYDGRNNRNITAVQSEAYKYIVTETETDVVHELYDKTTDPAENQDVISDPENVPSEVFDKGDRHVHHNHEVINIRDGVKQINEK